MNQNWALTMCGFAVFNMVLDALVYATGGQWVVQDRPLHPFLRVIHVLNAALTVWALYLLAVAS